MSRGLRRRCCILLNSAQVCCRVLSAESCTTDAKDGDSENPWWQLVGVLLPPFLHGLCMCVDRSRVAEGLLPPLVSCADRLVRGCICLYQPQACLVFDCAFMFVSALTSSPFAHPGAPFGGAISSYQQETQRGGSCFKCGRGFAPDSAHEPRGRPGLGPFWMASSTSVFRIG